MAQKHSGFRAKTRRKLRQKPSYRPAITKFLQEYKMGQNVLVLQEPSSHKGMPHPRFMGKTGVVKEKRGRSYIVEIMDGNRLKKVISRPEHLKAVG